MLQTFNYNDKGCGQELQYDLYRGRLLGILVELWLCLIRVAPKLINPKWSSH